MDKNQKGLSRRAESVIKSGYLHSALQRKKAALINKIAMQLIEQSVIPWSFKSRPVPGFLAQNPELSVPLLSKSCNKYLSAQIQLQKALQQSDKILTASKKEKEEGNPQHPGLDHCYHLTAAQWRDTLQVIPSPQRDRNTGSQEQRTYTNS